MRLLPSLSLRSSRPFSRLSARVGASLVLATAVTCVPSVVNAFDTGLQLGQSSFKFLKLPLSPRTAAMGGAGAGLASGAGEADVNPAAAALQGGVLVLGQDYPPQEFGTTASHLAWSLPWADRRVTFGARYLGFDKIPGWDASGASTTAYDAYTMKLQAGLAGKALGFAYGVSAAFAQNNVAEATYSAALVNAGVLRDLGHGLSAGASMMNADVWTATSKADGEKPSAPVIFQAGLGYVRPLKPGMAIALAADARKVNDEDWVVPVGAEMMFMDALFVRAGYPVGDPDNGIGLGLGLKWSRFSFNYSYKHHSALSGEHGWALEIRD